MPYQVLDNGRPADSKNQNLRVDYGWDNSIFTTLNEAVDYAASYFYPYPAPKKVEKIDYSGYGDMAEIRFVTP